MVPRGPQKPAVGGPSGPSPGSLHLPWRLEQGQVALNLHSWACPLCPPLAAGPFIKWGSSSRGGFFPLGGLTLRI